MGKSATNLIVLLGLVVIAFAGYYLYTRQSGSLQFRTDDLITQDMLRNTKQFIDYGETLERVNLDVSFFEDDRFRSLRSFTTSIQDRPIGRPDPFAETTAVNPASRNF